MGRVGSDGWGWVVWLVGLVIFVFGCFLSLFGWVGLGRARLGRVQKSRVGLVWFG